MACAAKGILKPGCLAIYCLMRSVISKSSPECVSQPPICRMNFVRNAPKAPEILLITFHSASPVLAPCNEIIYSMACIRETRLTLSFLTRNEPPTAGTLGSVNSCTIWLTISLSKEVSASNAKNNSPFAIFKAAFDDETRPPRCHFGKIIKLRRV